MGAWVFERDAMRILYVADVVEGAAKLHVTETCRHLAMLGESVELIINDDVKISGVAVVRVPDVQIRQEPGYHHGSVFKILVQDTIMLLKALFKKCDVIYTRNGFLALQMKILRPWKKVVWEMNGISRVEFPLMKELRLKTALAFFMEERVLPLFVDKVVVITEGMKRFLAADGVPENKMAVVFNGVDCEKFNPNIDGGAIRQKFGIPEKEKLLIFVGKLAAWHGADHMLAIFELLAQKMKNVKLMIVGISDADLDRFAPSLSKEAREQIMCAGWVENEKIPEYMAAADAGVHLGTHDYDLNPFKVLEYMACGKPVIGTTRGLSEIISASKGGIVVDPLEREKSAEAICSFLADEAKLTEAGCNAREYVAENHRWEKVTEKLVKTLKATFKDKRMAQ